MSSTPRGSGQNQEPSRNRDDSEAQSFGGLFHEIARNLRFDDETNDEEPQYKCPKCKDTGWLRTTDDKGRTYAGHCPCRLQLVDLGREQQRHNKGKDELNLCSVALFDFSRGRKKRSKAILRDITRPDGSLYRISASTNPDIGLPTGADQDLIVILEQITWEQKSPERVLFEPEDLLRRLGRTGGNNYKHTRQGFKRLAAMLVELWSGWYDKKDGKLTNVGGFHILDSYNWPTKEDLEKGASPQCFFSWGDAIRASMKVGAWRALDLGVYRKIQSNIGRFAYRYAMRALHKREEHIERTDQFYKTILGLDWKDNSPAMMVKMLQEHLAELPEVAGIDVRITPGFIQFKKKP